MMFRFVHCNNSQFTIKQGCFKCFKSPAVPTELSTIMINKIGAVVWSENESYTWYLGYDNGFELGDVVLDHLIPKNMNSNTHCKYPSHEDVQRWALLDQILDCEIVGEYMIWLLTPEKDFFILLTVKL